MSDYLDIARGALANAKSRERNEVFGAGTVTDGSAAVFAHGVDLDRLRKFAGTLRGTESQCAMIHDAIDEIERLRRVLGVRRSADGAPW